MGRMTARAGSGPVGRGTMAHGAAGRRGARHAPGARGGGGPPGGLLLGVAFVLALLGIVFYSNMMHLACIVSLFLALAAGVAFAHYANRQRIRDALRQEELRRRLTADVAHGLRTPLASVSANLEAIASGALEPTPERLMACHGEIRRLAGLVSDMERLARTENGLLALDMRQIDLLEAAREAFPGAQGESVLVRADRERVLLALGNLVDNAVRHGGGEARVTVRDAGRMGELRVSDSGAGIPEEDLPHVFERFYRAPAAKGREGSGIGLAIVKGIAEAHGGSVGARSEPGAGSEFWMTLPK